MAHGMVNLQRKLHGARLQHDRDLVDRIALADTASFCREHREGGRITRLPSIRGRTFTSPAGRPSLPADLGGEKDGKRHLRDLVLQLLDAVDMPCLLYTS